MLGPAARTVVDVSDNRARDEALEKLCAAVSADAPLSLPPWSVPGDGTPHSLSGTSMGNLWQHLNALRVAYQYTHLLGEMCSTHPFLVGDPCTCVMGLEWLSPLVVPLAPLDDQLQRTLQASVAAFQSKMRLDTVQEAAFEAHRHLACTDRAMTTLLLGMHFSGCREYDIDVCAWMLASPGITYSSWLADFPRWRDSGLFFPMVLASQTMPTLYHWLPPEVHGTPLATCFSRCLNTLPHPCTFQRPDLDSLASAWAADVSGASHILSGTLDRIAVLMRVKSNGRLGDPADMRLDPALASFPRDLGASMHDGNHAAWGRLASAIVDTFPPTLLSSPLVRPRKETWGFPRLTLCVTDGPVVRFAENSLSVVSPGLESEVHTHTPCFLKDCMYHQTSHRVQDVLWRLGEILTSRDVALGMLHPDIAVACIHGPPPSHMVGPVVACADRSHVLASMPSASRASCADYLAFAHALESVVPPITTEHCPRTSLLFWRVDIPPRAVLFMGNAADMDPASQSQHHLSKLLLNCKLPQRAVGGSGLCPLGATEHELRGVLRAFAASELRNHPCNVALARVDGQDATPEMARQTSPVTTTTLAESLACFALSPPAHLNVCRVGDSMPWSESNIDPRYAEKQCAGNGFRYRDWVAMHVGRGGTQQSRLAAHAIEFDALHVTKMPWICDGCVQWVRVASTVCPQSRTLQGRTLRQAVENRFLHDPRMLPVRSLGDTVVRGDTELYSEGNDRAVVVYSLASTQRLEMIAFQISSDKQ